MFQKGPLHVNLFFIPLHVPFCAFKCSFLYLSMFLFCTLTYASLYPHVFPFARLNIPICTLVTFCVLLWTLSFSPAPPSDLMNSFSTQFMSFSLLAKHLTCRRLKNDQFVGFRHCKMLINTLDPLWFGYSTCFARWARLASHAGTVFSISKTNST